MKNKFSSAAISKFSRAAKGALPAKAAAGVRLRWHLQHGERELTILREVAAKLPMRIAIDVGANLGIYSCLLSRTAKSVIALEPNRRIFRQLAAGVPGNVSALNAGAGDEPGMREFIIPTANGVEVHWRGSFQSGANDDFTNFNTYRFPVIMLDSLKLNEVDFIKVDVEGGELSVLQGAAATLRKCQPLLLVESEARHGTGPSSIADTLAAFGYAPYAYVAGAIHRCDDVDLAEFDQSTFGGSAATARRDYVNNFFFVPPRFHGAFERICDVAPTNALEGAR